MKKFYQPLILIFFLFGFTHCIHAQSWTNLGSGTNNSSHCMTTWNGMLIDGGSFNNPCNRIASWDGTTWGCMGTGVGLVARDAIDFNGDLIVCGDFWNVQQPCVGCNGIAKWNGTSWSPLGTGFNNDVLCLTIWNGELIAGGDFTQADGNPVSRIAKWNGTSWVGIGGTSDFSNDIRTMTVYDGELWVGGDFANAGGCSACDGLVKWDDATSTWIGGDYGVDITGGVDSTVRVLFVDQANDLLYMGGHFIELTIDGVPNTNFNGMAVYDGSVWTPLGVGVNSYVRAINKYNGNITVGGDFTTAGGSTANKVAKWNPVTSTWSAMGTGMNDYVKSMEVWNGTLYAGGPFTTADGLTRNCIASWYEAPSVSPVAVINASSTATCAGSCINFSDDSDNSPTSWTWSFPGGTPSTSTSQNPGLVCYATSGTYNVTHTACNANGCNTTTQTITINNGPNVTVNNLGLCTGQSGTLTANGASTYTWSPGTGLSATIGSSVTANPSVTTIYTVTGTAAGGCTATATATVTVTSPPTPTATNGGPYCVGQNIQLNSPSGSATDDWAGPGGWTQANTQNPIRTGATLAMAGVYTVTVTNAGGCSATATTTVVVNSNPTPTATNAGPYCVGATIQLNSPSGSASDDWIGPAGYVQNNLQNPTIASSTIAMSGVYTVTVTNVSGCSATATTSVVVNSNPTPTATNSGSYCIGQTIQLNSPAGSSTDDWTGPGGYIQNNTQNPTIAGATLSMAGIYTVTVTNAAGCSATATTSVVVNSNPTPTATNTGPYCAGETILLNSPSGSSTDDWIGPAGYGQNNMQNPSIVNSTTSMSGVYTVTVTNASGCSATATTSVTVNAPLVIASNTGPYCIGSTIDLNSSGGTGYSWSGPLSFTSGIQNPSIPSSTIAMSGVYTVVVSDASGCTASATTTVSVNTTPTSSASNAGPFCAEDVIQLNATGGGGYDWTGPLGFTSILQNPTVSSATVSMGGVYTVTVTLVGGCSATATTTVTVNALPDNSIIQNGINLSANQSGATYQWLDCNNSFAVLPGETNQNFTATANGSYAVEVTINGCADTSACAIVNNVGVEQLPNGEYLLVYPNPFTNIINLRVPNNCIGLHFSVIELSGKKLMTGLISSEIMMVNLEHLTAGMYILKVDEHPEWAIKIIHK